MNLLDVLLDENNRDPICMSDDEGRILCFEQVAVIPYRGRIYCILKPLDKVKGIKDDEAIAFYVDMRGEEPALKVVERESTALTIFEKYYDLLEAEAANRGQK